MYKQAPLSLRDINPVVRLFIVSNFFVAGGAGLIAPIFALFITDFIPGATIETVGVAVSVYLITRSIGQVPIGVLIDRWRGQRDDMLILLLSNAGYVMVALAFLFINSIGALFLLQFIYGVCAAAAYPTWYAIFSRSIDRGKEGIEWSSYQTIEDLGTASTAMIGGFLAAQFGFQTVFLLMAVMVGIGIVFLWWARAVLFKK